MRRLRALAAGVLIAGPFYLLLIDTGSSPELYTGAAAVLLAAVAYEFAYAEGSGHAGYRPRWLRRVPRVLLSVPRQITSVCAEILAQTLNPRTSRGRLRMMEFAAGDDEPLNRGRRVLAEALGTLAPNVIVLGVDPGRGILLAHELHHSQTSQIDALGLAGDAEPGERTGRQGPAAA